MWVFLDFICFLVLRHDITLVILFPFIVLLIVTIYQGPVLFCFCFWGFQGVLGFLGGCFSFGVGFVIDSLGRRRLHIVP